MRPKYFSKPILLVLIVCAALLVLPFIGIVIQNQAWLSPTEKILNKKLKAESETLSKLNLEDPGQAPKEIRDLVRYGYQLMVNTPQYAQGYVGDAISCANCHFSGGNTTGGKNGGISLVGVAAKYPAFNERTEIVEDLPQRINFCFERSLNGKALPLDSKEMLALVTYLHWISKGTPIYDSLPWLGLKKLSSDHLPDLEEGKKGYETYCAMCHGTDGNGKTEHRIPPVWGEKSFNNKAGMAKQETMSSFIFYNMPYYDAHLTEEQAIDISAYILNQPRS